MDVYKYVAQADPNKAKQLIQSFGYEIVSANDLGKSLNELVNNTGEAGLKGVMDIHPEKNLILELFSKEDNSKNGESCSCNSCKQKNANNHGNGFLNASGDELFTANKESNTSATLAHQTNVILVVSVVFIASAMLLSLKTSK